jgi:hypothetical protein
MNEMSNEPTCPVAAINLDTITAILRDVFTVLMDHGCYDHDEQILLLKLGIKTVENTIVRELADELDGMAFNE